MPFLLNGSSGSRSNTAQRICQLAITQTMKTLPRREPMNSLHLCRASITWTTEIVWIPRREASSLQSGSVCSAVNTTMHPTKYWMPFRLTPFRCFMCARIEEILKCVLRRNSSTPWPSWSGIHRNGGWLMGLDPGRGFWNARYPSHRVLYPISITVHNHMRWLDLM